MGIITEGIPRGCQGLFTPVSLGYPLSVFNKNSTLRQTNKQTSSNNDAGLVTQEEMHCTETCQRNEE